MSITLKDILKARDLLKGVATHTSMSYSHLASEMFGSSIYFKLENQQRTGSFKIRGAYNKICNLSDAEKAKGIIASSAGNHAQGVAYAAKASGTKATIVMPLTAPIVKVQATKSYGANVIQFGEIYDQAYEHAKELAAKEGFVFVHPYEDQRIIAGQGTIALEINEDLPDVDTLVVPIGGGGLISGIAVAMKELNPNCKIIGVQASGCPAMYESFKAKHIQHFTGRVSTIADGIAVKTPSQYMYDHFISKYVDDIVTVSDDQIAESMVWLLERAKAVVEGSGAASFAAVMSKQIKPGKKNCILLSGGNVDINMIARVIELGLRQKGRLTKLELTVEDVPGSLSKITSTIADLRANILEIHHDRASSGLYLRETNIEVLLEATGFQHIEQIKDALKKIGCRVN